MFNFLTPKALDCPEIGLRVQVNRTELQCRAKHGCEQQLCPLKGEFKRDSYDQFLADAYRQPL